MSLKSNTVTLVLTRKTYDQMLKQAANATTYEGRMAGAGYVTDEVRVGESRARAALAAIGIKRP